MQKSAGIIVIRFFPEPKVLTLKIYGNYDLPKGMIEDGESELEAAIRETYEEAGIDSLNFKWGKEGILVKKSKGRRKKTCRMFLAETTQNATILPNPLTNKIEHHSVKWMTFKDAEDSVHEYLRPSIAWAEDKLFNKLCQTSV